MQNLNQDHLLLQQSAVLFTQFFSFEQKIQQLAQLMEIDLSQYEIDHIALRTNQLSTTQDWQQLLTKCGTILSQNVVNGRLIYLFELDSPLLFLQQKVKVIELPYPKNKQYPHQGWEHIEIVMPFLAQESVPNWLERIQQQFLWNQSPQLRVKVSEPKVEGEQLANPSIAVSLTDNSNNHCCIKVHPYSIKHIIEV